MTTRQQAASPAGSSRCAPRRQGPAHAACRPERLAAAIRARTGALLLLTSCSCIGLLYCRAPHPCFLRVSLHPGMCRPQDRNRTREGWQQLVEDSFAAAERKLPAFRMHRWGGLPPRRHAVPGTVVMNHQYSRRRHSRQRQLASVNLAWDLALMGGCGSPPAQVQQAQHDLARDGPCPDHQARPAAGPRGGGWRALPLAPGRRAQARRRRQRKVTACPARPSKPTVSPQQSLWLLPAWAGACCALCSRQVEAWKGQPQGAHATPCTPSLPRLPAGCVPVWRWRRRRGHGGHTTCWSPERLVPAAAHGGCTSAVPPPVRSPGPSPLPLLRLRATFRPLWPAGRCRAGCFV